MISKYVFIIDLHSFNDGDEDRGGRAKSVGKNKLGKHTR